MVWWSMKGVKKPPIEPVRWDKIGTRRKAEEREEEVERKDILDNVSFRRSGVVIEVGELVPFSRGMLRSRALPYSLFSPELGLDIWGFIFLPDMNDFLVGLSSLVRIYDYDGSIIGEVVKRRWGHRVIALIRIDGNKFYALYESFMHGIEDIISNEGKIYTVHSRW